MNPRKLWFVVLALLVSACGVPRPLPPESRSAIRSVAVVSALGDQIEFVKLGHLVFLNDHQTTAVDWNLDKIVADAAERRLQNSGRPLSVTRSTIDAKDLAGLYKLEPFTEFVDPARIESRLRQIAAAGAADAIVLVTRDRQKDPVARSGTIYLDGPGLYYLHMSVMTSNPWMKVAPYAILNLYVIDAKTMKPIALAKRAAQQRKYYEGTSWNRPPPSPFKDDIKPPLTQPQAAFLRSELERIIAPAVDEMLAEVGL